MGPVQALPLRAFEFELQAGFYVLFRPNIILKGSNPLISRDLGLILPLLLFNKNDLGIILHTKVDMPLTRETKSNLKNREYCISF